jgi:hypothetical protein
MRTLFTLAIAGAALALPTALAAEDRRPEPPLPAETRLYAFSEIPSLSLPLDGRTDLQLGARIDPEFAGSGLDALQAWTLGIRTRW